MTTPVIARLGSPHEGDSPLVLNYHPSQTYVRVMPGNWRPGARYAHQLPDPEPYEGPGLTWRQLAPRHWPGTSDSKIRGTVTRDGDGWVAYLRLEDPPGLSPITTVGRFATVKEAQIAADEVGVPMTGRDAHSSGTTGGCPALRLLQYKYTGLRLRDNRTAATRTPQRLQRPAPHQPTHPRTGTVP
jgi:hypothetical protein